MDSWILQGGFPLVSLDGQSLTQQPFSYGPAGPDGDSAIGGPWQVPVLTRHLESGDTVGERLLLGEAPAAAAEGQGPTLVNAGGWGVYRVAYAPPQLGELVSRLGELDALECFNLVSDTWAEVLAGRAELADFVALVGGLGDVDEPSTYAVVAGALGLCDRVADDGDRPLVAEATRRLLGPRLASVGWDRRPGEAERMPTMRALLVRALGTVGEDGDVRAEADRRFAAAKGPEGAGRGATPIDPDLEGAVLDVVGASGRRADYEAFLERYRHPVDPQEEARYLHALAAFPSPDLCRRSFELALGEVRTQNAPYLVRDLLANRDGGPAVWDRVTTEWATIVERFPNNSLPRMVDGVRLLCGDAKLAGDVASFLDDHPLATGERTVRQILERLRVNVAFGARHAGRLGPELAAPSGGR